MCVGVPNPAEYEVRLQVRSNEKVQPRFWSLPGGLPG